MEGESMERTVGTSLLLQMMRNRVHEVEDEYYLYLNAIEDKLLERQVISNSEWQILFNESGLPKEEQHNFNKVWVEAYIRYYFFRKCLKDLPNTTDINTARRIVTVDDLAYSEILKMKLAYVYGNKIQDYESIVERWVSDEYVIQWLMYETYRKIGDYWDMDFASDHSVFDSVYKYERRSLEGLDPTKYILEQVETMTDLENLLRFTFYCYNDMSLPRVPMEYVNKEYEWYAESKEKGILKYLDKIPSSATMGTVNTPMGVNVNAVNMSINEYRKRIDLKHEFKSIKELAINLPAGTKFYYDEDLELFIDGKHIKSPRKDSHTGKVVIQGTEERAGCVVSEDTPDLIAQCLSQMVDFFPNKFCGRLVDGDYFTIVKVLKSGLRI